MSRGFLAGIAVAGVALGPGFVACSDDRTDAPTHAHGGEAGEGGAAAGNAGETTQTGGAGNGTSGGNGGTNGGGTNGGGSSGGGAGGRGGTATGGAGQGPSGGGSDVTGGTSSGAGAGGVGDGGAAGGGSPEVVVCDRLGAFEAGSAADRIRFNFERDVFRDCRVSWFTSLYLPPVDERALYGTNLKAFTLGLWGCLDEAPTQFLLIHQQLPLSSAEAQVLIDYYMAQSLIQATLSPAEVEVVERQLARLAAPLIDPSLADFSRSRCTDGGTGGEGGAPGGAGGLGGG